MFNEENRLDIKHFILKKDICYILVNDGSTDRTLSKLKEEIIPKLHQFHLITYPQNKGKAFAVSSAFNFLKEHNVGADDTVGYIDADFSVKVEDYLALIDFLNDKTKFVFGSRKNGVNIVVKKRIRYVIGRLISICIKLFSGLDYYDTQCGCKIFNGKVLYKIKKSFLCNWLFDVELIMQLKKEDPIEVAINWKHIGGSKIKFYHFPDIVLDLVKILFLRFSTKVKIND